MTLFLLNEYLLILFNFLFEKFFLFIVRKIQQIFKAMMKCFINSKSKKDMEQKYNLKNNYK